MASKTQPPFPGIVVNESQKHGKKEVTAALGIPSDGGCTGSPGLGHVMSHLGHALGTIHIRCVGEVGGDAAGEIPMNPSWVLK